MARYYAYPFGASSYAWSNLTIFVCYASFNHAITELPVLLWTGEFSDDSLIPFPVDELIHLND